MVRLTMSFLGTIQIALAQQPIAHFRSANNQGLLVYLALEGERPHTREVLATLFWPEETDKNARNNLRQALYRLRKVLGDLEEPTEPYLLVTRQTVQFNPGSDYHLDVDAFVKAIEAGNLEIALSHYQGELLPGFTCDSVQFEDWLRQERERLHQLALEAMFEVAEGHLQANRFAQAQAVARQQLSLEPWRERAHRQLMRANALTGDRSSALAQFEACQATLAEELGVEPAPETIALADEIEAGRVGPVVSEETVRPPKRTRHNLPAETTPFIGREQELRRIEQLLTGEQQRLVTIVGPGGMGKTRLALVAGAALLEAFADGVYFVDLAPLNKAEEIPPAIAAALDYRAPEHSQPLLPQLLRMLSRRNLLLILDNFEHLLEGAALVTEILQSCPDVAMLTTSRLRLNLASESVHKLEGLGLPRMTTPEDALSYPAVQLFVDSGRRVRSDFGPTPENMPGVLRICRLVEGMPLALMLAAAWLELLTPGEIATEIESRLDILAADLTDLPARQRSIEAVFRRTWQMMSPTEQTALSQLSIFRSSFRREAAEEVAGANLHLLLSLTHMSLLRRTESGRFTVHELLRKFALSQLQRAGRKGRVSRAHCRYFARLTAREVRRLLTIFLVRQTGTLEAERDNIQQAWAYALKHSRAEELADLSGAIVLLQAAGERRATSVLEEAIQILQQSGLSETHPAMVRLNVVHLILLAGIDRPLARQRLEELASAIEKVSQQELRYWVYMGLAHAGRFDLDPEALGWAKKAYQIACAMNNDLLAKLAEAHELWLRVILSLDEETTVARLQEMLTYFEAEYPDIFVVYGILWSLSSRCAELTEYTQAIHYGKRALGIAKSWRDLLWISHASQQLADIYLELGRSTEARNYILDILKWHLAVGQEWQTVGALSEIAANYPQLFGSYDIVVSILAMAYHHPETIPVYQVSIEQALPRLQAKLAPTLFAVAWERGKDLDFDVAVALMRSALTNPAKKPPLHSAD